MSSLLGLSPLSLSTITTLSCSHVIAGAAVAMSSLGSALAIAMMVGGDGAPPLAAWLGPDLIPYVHMIVSNSGGPPGVLDPVLRYRAISRDFRFF